MEKIKEPLASILVEDNKKKQYYLYLGLITNKLYRGIKDFVDRYVLIPVNDDVYTRIEKDKEIDDIVGFCIEEKGKPGFFYKLRRSSSGSGASGGIVISSCASDDFKTENNDFIQFRKKEEISRIRFTWS